MRKNGKNNMETRVKDKEKTSIKSSVKENAKKMQKPDRHVTFQKNVGAVSIRGFLMRSS